MTRELAGYLEAFLEAAELAKDAPLFPALAGRTGKWSGKAMSRIAAFRMIKRRCNKAGLSEEVACHSFRGSGITAYLAAGGTIDRARTIAAHESAETTKLYDRTQDEITAADLERVAVVSVN